MLERLENSDKYRKKRGLGRESYEQVMNLFMFQEGLTMDRITGTVPRKGRF